MDVAIDQAWRRFKESYALLSVRTLAVKWEGGPFAVGIGGLSHAAGWTLFHSLLAVVTEAIERQASGDAPRSQRERLLWLKGEVPEADSEAIDSLLKQYDRIYEQRTIDEEELARVAEEDRAEHLRFLQRVGRRGPPPQLLLAPIAVIERLLLNWKLIESIPTFATSTSVTWHYAPGNRIVAPGPQHFGVRHTARSDDGDESSSFTALPLDPAGVPLDWEPGLKDLEQAVASWERFAGGAANRAGQALAGDRGSIWIAGHIKQELLKLAGEIEAIDEVKAKVPEEFRQRVEAMGPRLLAVRDRLEDVGKQVDAIL